MEVPYSDIDGQNILLLIIPFPDSELQQMSFSIVLSNCHYRLFRYLKNKII